MAIVADHGSLKVSVSKVLDSLDNSPEDREYRIHTAFGCRSCRIHFSALSRKGVWDAFRKSRLDDTNAISCFSFEVIGFLIFMFKSQVSLRVVDGSALIELLDGSVNAASDHLEPDLLSFIDAEDAKQQAKQQQLGRWRFLENGSE